MYPPYLLLVIFTLAWKVIAIHECVFVKGPHDLFQVTYMTGAKLRNNSSEIRHEVQILVNPPLERLEYPGG
jgi:hypothetical protein